MIFGVQFLFQQAERDGETMHRCRRGRRAAGDPYINGDDGIAAAPDAVEIVKNTAADAACAIGDRDFVVRRGMPARSAGIRMARVTAPVNSKMSA